MIVGIVEAIIVIMLLIKNNRNLNERLQKVERQISAKKTF